jgi:hypothetical protein
MTDKRLANQNTTKRQGGAISATRKKAAGPMIAIAALITLVYLFLSVIVISVDPHNIYSWGSEPRIKENHTPGDIVIDWIEVAAKDQSYNTILVGSSVTKIYPPEKINKLLGHDVRTANISYGGPRPKDRDLVLKRVSEKPNVERIIMTFDAMYIRDQESVNLSFPAFLYDEGFSNDLRQVNLPTILRTLRVLKGERIYQNPDEGGFEKYTEDKNRSFHTKDKMHDLTRLIARYKPTIGALSNRSCDSFTAIQNQLAPSLRDISEWGIAVDILIPVVSYAYYYARQTDISPTVLDEALIARRCLVQAVKGLKNVRIHALDADPKIAGDLANYRDEGHLHGQKMLDMFISAINSDQFLLTSDNVEAQEQAIRQAVENYNLTNSNME